MNRTMLPGMTLIFQVPGYNRNWITPINLANRYLFSQRLLKILIPVKQVQLLMLTLWLLPIIPSILPILQMHASVVKAFTDYMFAVEINTDRFNYFLNTIFLESLAAYNWTNEWNSYKAGGSDAIVRLRLEILVAKLIQTPEFQLF